MIKTLASGQPVLVEPASVSEAARPPVPARSRFGLHAFAFASVAALFWMGTWAAWLWGYLGVGGLSALDGSQMAMLTATALLPPILFFAVAVVLARGVAMQHAAEAMLLASEKLFAADETAARSAARLSRAVRRELDALNTGLDASFQRVRALEQLIEHQIAALDEAGARAEVRGDFIALRLGQESQRIEILSNTLVDVAARAGETVAGKAAQLRSTLDTAEGMLTHRVEVLADTLDEAAARANDTMAVRSAQMKNTLDTAESLMTQRVEILAINLNDAAVRANETIAGRAAQMKTVVETAEGALNQRLEHLAASLIDAAARASETVAGRAAQLRATLETVEGTLKMAGQSLDVQAAGFRAAASTAADAPLNAAAELGRATSRIQEVSDAAMGRAEFVLARFEKHRSGLGEQLNKLKEDGDFFETALSQQRTGMESAIAALAAEAQKFEGVAGDAERHLDLMMTNAASRASQLTAGFAVETQQLKEIGEAAAEMLANLVATLADAGSGAQSLIADSTAKAKQDARLLVGEAMAECDRLLRASGEMSEQAGKIRVQLAKTTEDMERHLLRLPGLAQEEARRVRQMMAAETEQILDLSARTLSTIHARSSNRSAPPPAPGVVPQPAPEPEPEGFKGLARKLMARQKKKDVPAPKGDANWEMKALLAAAEYGENDERALRPGSAAALAALEMALADIAVDLSALDEGAVARRRGLETLSGGRPRHLRAQAGGGDRFRRGGPHRHAVSRR